MLTFKTMTEGNSSEWSSYGHSDMQMFNHGLGGRCKRIFEKIQISLKRKRNVKRLKISFMNNE